jgi:hypothetical protein
VKACLYGFVFRQSHLVPGGCDTYAHPPPVKELAEGNRRMATTEVTIALEKYLGKHGLWPPPAAPSAESSNGPRPAPAGHSRAPAGPERRTNSG